MWVICAIAAGCGLLNIVSSLIHKHGKWWAAFGWMSGTSGVLGLMLHYL